MKWLATLQTVIGPTCLERWKNVVWGNMLTYGERCPKVCGASQFVSEHFQRGDCSLPSLEGTGDCLQREASGFLQDGSLSRPGGFWRQGPLPAQFNNGPGTGNTSGEQESSPSQSWQPWLQRKIPGKQLHWHFWSCLTWESIMLSTITSSFLLQLSPAALLFEK